MTATRPICSEQGCRKEAIAFYEDRFTCEEHVSQIGQEAILRVRDEARPIEDLESSTEEVNLEQPTRRITPGYVACCTVTCVGAIAGLVLGFIEICENDGVIAGFSGSGFRC